MIVLVVTLLAVSSFNLVLAEETAGDLSCTEFKNDYIGSVFYIFSSKPTYDGANFYLASKDSVDGVEINENDWMALKSDSFDPSRKTYFIIHGYIDHHKKGWIRKLKKALLDTHNVNLIIIDWSKGSQTWNYVNAVQTTYLVAQDIVNFLENMKNEVSHFKNFTESQLWTNLYFIGHSLGAHISGQVGHILKTKKSSFKLERITGLDPAQPCFKRINNSLSLDPNDADFVDVIHTQTGNGEKISGFGLQKPSGHLDFYVNGGVMQPECEIKSVFYTEINKMICSHNLAHTFFTTTVNNLKTADCKLLGYQWDGSYKNALEISHEVHKSNQCSNCEEMGINAINHRTIGRYLVITSASTPYCQLKNDDESLITKAIDKLKSATTLFPQLPSNPFKGIFSSEWLNFNKLKIW